jgi:hypothetical protein
MCKSIRDSDGRVWTKNWYTCPSSRAAREPISVAMSFDLLRKRRVMMEDVNVSNVRERWAGC